MSRTLLQLVQQAADELGITQPQLLFSSTGDQERQLVALAKREGEEYSRVANHQGGWQQLQKEYIFSTVCNATTTGNTVSGSAVITGIPSTSGIVADTWTVSGNGIRYQAKVVSVDSPNQVTINIPATATATNISLSFGQKAYDLPSDFAYFLNQTFWDGSYRWQLLGPLEAQEKQVLRWGISPVGPRRRFWVLQDKIWLDPTPSTSGDIIAYDYYSTNWCKSATTTPQSIWQADTDTYLLDEDAFIQGMKWRYLRAKGLDYSQEKVLYDEVISRILSRNGGARTLPINSMNMDYHLLSSANIPDTGFGA